jgi:aspartate ammonia-lyase
MSANEHHCSAAVANATASVTALVATLGYETAADIAAEMQQTGKSLQCIVAERKLLTGEELKELLSAEAVCRLGDPRIRKRNNNHV